MDKSCASLLVTISYVGSRDGIFSGSMVELEFSAVPSCCLSRFSVVFSGLCTCVWNIWVSMSLAETDISMCLGDTKVQQDKDLDIVCLYQSEIAVVGLFIHDTASLRPGADSTLLLEKSILNCLMQGGSS